MRTCLADLGRRKLGHWALAYLAGAWLLLQVLDLLAQPFAWPALVLRAATVVVAVGFLAVLVIAWYHGERGAQRVSGVELLMLAGILVLAGAAVAYVSRSNRSDEGQAAAASVTVPRAEPTPEQGAIAVLPFVNASSDPEQEYFSDGLTDDIRAVLSELPGLRVAARTSSFAFKGHQAGIDSIARTLRVRHVLEGSVRRAEDRLRITAQLIDATSGYQVWTDSYDRKLSDVFALQDEIARAIVAQLRLTLSPERAGAPLARQETADPEAHALVLRAGAAIRTGLVGDAPKAVRLLRQALERDPDYARAHAELASSLRLAAYFRQVPRVAGYREARQEAERALELDSSLVQAHVALALVAEWYDWNWQEAERHYRRALELNPGDPRAHGNLAWLLMRLHRREEAIAEARQAVALDPLSPELHNTLGAVLMYARQYEAALEAFQAALALQPDSPIWLGNVAQVRCFEGRFDEALRLARRTAAMAPGEPYLVGPLGYMAARAGERREAEQALRVLEATPEASEYLEAMVHAALGGTDRALELLEVAVAKRDEWAADLAIDPFFDILRGDPRLARLLRSGGLP